MEIHKEKILVVDDEASIRRILETRLSMIGYDVVTAADGEEALEIFRNSEPDLVVLDVMMPKLDGYGVCQELRKESDVPIIMLTAPIAIQFWHHHVQDDEIWLRIAEYFERFFPISGGHDIIANHGKTGF